MDARGDILGLLADARRGVPDAIGRILESARAQLHQLADRDLPDDVRVRIGPSDLVQETAVDAQRDFARFVGTTPEELFAWLREILRHNVIDAIRHHRDALKREAAREVSLGAGEVLRAAEAIPQAARSPRGSAIRREEAAGLGLVMARLPADYREVLELRYWQGLSFPEIAARLGRSREAVRKLWYRAVARLNEELVANAAGGASPPPPAPE